MGSTDISSFSSPRSITDDRRSFLDQCFFNTHYQWAPTFRNDHAILSNALSPVYLHNVEPQSLCPATKDFRLTTETFFSPTAVETSYKDIGIADADLLKINSFPVRFDDCDGSGACYIPWERVGNGGLKSEVMLPRLERNGSSSSLGRTYGDSRGMTAHHSSPRGEESRQGVPSIASTTAEALPAHPQRDEPINNHGTWPPDSPTDTYDSIIRVSSIDSSQPSTPIDTSPSQSPTSPETSKAKAPTCTNCYTQTTPLWRRDLQGAPLCNACGLYLKLHAVSRPLSFKTDVIKKRNRGPASKSLSTTGRGISPRTATKKYRYTFVN